MAAQYGARPRKKNKERQIEKKEREEGVRLSRNTPIIDGVLYGRKKKKDHWMHKKFYSKPKKGRGGGLKEFLGGGRKDKRILSGKKGTARHRHSRDGERAA